VVTQTGSSYICESVTVIFKITMDTWVFDHIDKRKHSRPFHQPSHVEIADKTRNTYINETITDRIEILRQMWG